jgi:hypothetical protein
MPEPGTFTPETPYASAAFTDDGAFWRFAYWGTGYIYIRETTDETGDALAHIGRASRDLWPYLIDLNDYGMRPEQVTRQWLAERVADWIISRNEDLRKGNL